VNKGLVNPMGATGITLSSSDYTNLSISCQLEKRALSLVGPKSWITFLASVDFPGE